MNFYLDGNIELLQQAINYIGSSFTEQRSLKMNAIAADTLVKLINCQNELVAQTGEKADVMYLSYKVYKYIEGRGGNVSWKQLITSHVLSGGSKAYRKAVDFLMAGGALIEFEENKYQLKGKLALTDGEEQNEK